MAQLSIGVAVRNLIEAKGEWYDGEVEAALAKLQEVLGVTSRDVAGMFLSEHDEKWDSYNETNKFSVIQDYINAVTAALYGASTSHEESHNRMVILQSVIDKEKAALEKLVNDKDDSYWGSDEYTQHTIEVCDLLRQVWGYDIHETPAWTDYCHKASAPEICQFVIEQCEQKSISLDGNIF
ncbi:MAG: hypothetical protein CMF12_08625 [Idiomarina sp.]|uniref:hypothetical protein n=1 Tax=Idiomarina sp. TaxID=1874361 RepID=UPI000C4DE097|nr:hypothetical protein [Idiomarina sp.]MBT42574.1 hypothetical protein [Idiomarina sp.]